MLRLNLALGDTIRRIRTEQGKTLRELGKVSNVSLGYLSEVERGVKQASLEIVEDLANGLNLSAAELLKEVYEYLEEQNTCKN
jgi:transcriptional regulator with XRE-family HTH domain